MSETGYETNGSLVGERYFSKRDVSPYDELKWTKSDVPITDDDGTLLFIQKDFWSQEV